MLMGHIVPGKPCSGEFIATHRPRLTSNKTHLIDADSLHETIRLVTHLSRRLATVTASQQPRRQVELRGHRHWAGRKAALKNRDGEFDSVASAPPLGHQSLGSVNISYSPLCRSGESAFYRQDEELLVDAPKLAAKMQSGNRRELGLWSLGRLL